MKRGNLQQDGKDEFQEFDKSTDELRPLPQVELSRRLE